MFRRCHTGAMERMGPLEETIMSVLWTAPDALAATEVTDQLADTHPVTYTTVMTILERLREKGLVQREKQGRAFRYTPMDTPDEYVSQRLTDVLSDARDATAALGLFAGSLSDDEADALRAALARSRRQRAKA